MVASGAYDSEEAMGALQISEVIEADYSLLNRFNAVISALELHIYFVKAVR